jgi:hypothetical protein
MNANEPRPDEDQTPSDYDEYGDVPDSGDTTGTEERPDQDDSPLG